MNNASGEHLMADAAMFAMKAHQGQKRKYTGQPYIIHPSEVASIVFDVEHTAEMVAAAWLHDVVEDTIVSLSAIRSTLGSDVADLVGWLTDDALVTGNRAARKHDALLRLAAAPAEAQTIKLADLIANTRDIVMHDPKFAKVYLKEKNELLMVLSKGRQRLVASRKSAGGGMTHRWTYDKRLNRYSIFAPDGRLVALTYRQVDAEEMTGWLNRAPSFRGLEDEIERMSKDV